MALNFGPYLGNSVANISPLEKKIAPMRYRTKNVKRRMMTMASTLGIFSLSVRKSWTGESTK
jgi:hypothetical protein